MISAITSIRWIGLDWRRSLLRNSPRKWVWRADIVLATVDGRGTNAIMRRTGKSKPCVGFDRASLPSHGR
jgi:hypothetical protein